MRRLLTIRLSPAARTTEIGLEEQGDGVVSEVDLTDVRQVDYERLLDEVLKADLVIVW